MIIASFGLGDFYVQVRVACQVDEASTRIIAALKCFWDDLRSVTKAIGGQLMGLRPLRGDREHGSYRFRSLQVLRRKKSLFKARLIVL